MKQTCIYHTEYKERRYGRNIRRYFRVKRYLDGRQYVDIIHCEILDAISSLDIIHHKVIREYKKKWDKIFPKVNTQ